MEHIILAYLMVTWYVFGHLVCLNYIWYILWPYGIFCVHWVYFSGFGILSLEKFGNPGSIGSERIFITINARVY
jgi:hypothetical protein